MMSKRKRKKEKKNSYKIDIESTKQLFNRNKTFIAETCVLLTFSKRSRSLAWEGYRSFNAGVLFWRWQCIARGAVLSPTAHHPPTSWDLGPRQYLSGNNLVLSKYNRQPTKPIKQLERNGREAKDKTIKQRRGVGTTHVKRAYSQWDKTIKQRRYHWSWKDWRADIERD